MSTNPLHTLGSALRVAALALLVLAPSAAALVAGGYRQLFLR